VRVKIQHEMRGGFCRTCGGGGSRSTGTGFRPGVGGERKSGKVRGFHLAQNPRKEENYNATSSPIYYGNCRKKHLPKCDGTRKGRHAQKRKGFPECNKKETRKGKKTPQGRAQSSNDKGKRSSRANRHVQSCYGTLEEKKVGECRLTLTLGIECGLGTTTVPMADLDAAKQTGLTATSWATTRARKSVRREAIRGDRILIRQVSKNFEGETFPGKENRRKPQLGERNRSHKYAL